MHRIISTYVNRLRSIKRERERTFIDSDTVIHMATAMWDNNSLFTDTTINYFKQVLAICVWLPFSTTMLHTRHTQFITSACLGVSALQELLSL